MDNFKFLAGTLNLDANSEEGVKSASGKGSAGKRGCEVRKR